MRSKDVDLNDLRKPWECLEDAAIRYFTEWTPDSPHIGDWDQYRKYPRVWAKSTKLPPREFYDAFARGEPGAADAFMREHLFDVLDGLAAPSKAFRVHMTTLLPNAVVAWRDSIRKDDKGLPPYRLKPRANLYIRCEFQKDLAFRLGWNRAAVQARSRGDIPEFRFSLNAEDSDGRQVGDRFAWEPNTRVDWSRGIPRSLELYLGHFPRRESRGAVGHDYGLDMARAAVDGKCLKSLFGASGLTKKVRRVTSRIQDWSRMSEFLEGAPPDEFLDSLPPRPERFAREAAAVGVERAALRIQKDRRGPVLRRTAKEVSKWLSNSSTSKPGVIATSGKPAERSTPRTPAPKSCVPSG